MNRFSFLLEQLKHIDFFFAQRENMSQLPELCCCAAWKQHGGWILTRSDKEAETCHILAFFPCSCCLGTKRPRVGVWRTNSSIFTLKCLLLGSNQYLYLKKKYFSTFPVHCFGFIVCNDPTDSVCHCLLKSTTAVSTKKTAPTCSQQSTNTHIWQASTAHSSCWDKDFAF